MHSRYIVIWKIMTLVNRCKNFISDEATEVPEVKGRLHSVSEFGGLMPSIMTWRSI